MMKRNQEKKLRRNKRWRKPKCKQNRMENGMMSTVKENKNGKMNQRMRGK